MIIFEIPGRPMGKQRPRLGKGFTYTPKETVNYENLVKQIYISNKLPYMTGQICVDVTIQYDIPISTSKKKKELMLEGKIKPTKKPDIDNILKIIFDALNGIAYKDDTQIYKVTCTKMYAEEPKVIVSFMEG
ncbi:RusA family crossover junction endodeoxyribonuclease [Clostridium sp. SYSU_GA19001]|uniref:RusA family crossover junction endodeoxyribonuclease n=1 Tax=Clostridium caldaquaticum TaxID=2940653 RepID=UPI00207711BF|nr:RusA family crossover junction endodeoxyribonuclease [Clostridium caldaquaticum]MCM8710522.1 RusA family crossover junction endodeoxyribonuclease [Clostridium caldaquaticum]